MLMLYYMDGKTLTGEERKNFDAMLELPESAGDNRPNGPDTWQVWALRIPTTYLPQIHLNSINKTYSFGYEIS